MSGHSFISLQKQAKTVSKMEAASYIGNITEHHCSTLSKQKNYLQNMANVVWVLRQIFLKGKTEENFLRTLF